MKVKIISGPEYVFALKRAVSTSVIEVTYPPFDGKK